MSGAYVDRLFHEEPAGAFQAGYVFRSPPDLTAAQQDPDRGYWHCDVADQDRLTWSDRVYELFGLPAGTPIEREWAVGRYSEQSRAALQQLRSFGLKRDWSFILDAEIEPEGAGSRWIRILAVPISADGRVVGLHGVKRAL